MAVRKYSDEFKLTAVRLSLAYLSPLAFERRMA